MVKAKSRSKIRKRAGAGERQSGGACTHFFNVLLRFVPVYQLLIYHRAPTQSVCAADCYFIVNVLDLPFASPIAIYR